MDESSRATGWFRGIPGTVWALGLVSLFMDISSEMIHSLLPVFLVTALGASAMSVGLIEGVAEATALIAKTFSGVLSDWIGKRKTLTLLGYGLGALTKPFFALAASADMVFAARFADRIGKGIRTAPRDALVADVTPPDVRGAAYGMRQSLDNVGGFGGPLLAIALMAVFAGDFRRVFWIAVIPGFVSVAILAIWVREPAKSNANSSPKAIRLREIAALGPAYWFVVAVGAVFTLARFSEAFLILRADSVGLAASWVPLILVTMNVAYALTAYPVGALSDRLGRMGLMAAGLATLIVADLVLAAAANAWLVCAGAALWGTHMGFTQGILATLVADTAPVDYRGTAFGLFSLVSGLATLAASLLAGWLWARIGAPATFVAGAGFAAAALAGFVALRKWQSARSGAGPRL